MNLITLQVNISRHYHDENPTDTTPYEFFEINTGCCCDPLHAQKTYVSIFWGAESAVPWCCRLKENRTTAYTRFTLAFLDQLVLLSPEASLKLYKQKAKNTATLMKPHKHIETSNLLTLIIFYATSSIWLFWCLPWHDVVNNGSSGLGGSGPVSLLRIPPANCQRYGKSLASTKMNSVGHLIAIF